MKTTTNFKSVCIHAFGLIFLMGSFSVAIAQEETAEEVKEQTKEVKIIIDGDEHKVVKTNGADAEVEVIVKENGDETAEYKVVTKRAPMKIQEELPAEVRELLDKEGGKIEVEIEAENGTATKVIKHNGKEVYRETIEDYKPAGQKMIFIQDGSLGGLNWEEAFENFPGEMEMDVDLDELKETMKNMTFDIEMEGEDGEEVKVIRWNSDGANNVKHNCQYVIKVEKDDEEVDMSEIEEFIEKAGDGETYETVEEIITTGENGEKIIKRKIVIVEVETIEEVEVETEVEDASLKNDGAALQLEDFSFYPNPNNGQFRLNFTVPEKGKTIIRITDTTGKTVYEDVKKGLKGNFQGDIDISDKEKGVYFLQVIQGNKEVSKKIIVQ